MKITLYATTALLTVSYTNAASASCNGPKNNSNCPSDRLPYTCDGIGYLCCLWTGVPSGASETQVNLLTSQVDFGGMKCNKLIIPDSPPTTSTAATQQQLIDVTTTTTVVPPITTTADDLITTDAPPAATTTTDAPNNDSPPDVSCSGPNGSTTCPSNKLSYVCNDDENFCCQWSNLPTNQNQVEQLTSDLTLGGMPCVRRDLAPSAQPTSLAPTDPPITESPIATPLPTPLPTPVPTPAPVLPATPVPVDVASFPTPLPVDMTMNAFPTPMPMDYMEYTGTLSPAASDSWFVVEGKTTEAPFGEARANPYADNDDSSAMTPGASVLAALFGTFMLALVY